VVERRASLRYAFAADLDSHSTISLQGGMFGYSGDHPPGDVEGHINFIKSLRQPDVWEVRSACPDSGPDGVLSLSGERSKCRDRLESRTMAS